MGIKIKTIQRMTKVLKSPPKRGTPQYKEDGELKRRSYGFVFSDRIEDWIGAEYREIKKQFQVNRKDRKSGNSYQQMSVDNL